jgi:O-glycosyl hydrolase
MDLKLTKKLSLWGLGGFLLLLSLPLMAQGNSVPEEAGKEVSREVTIDTSKRLQTIEGWGVSLCWWAHMCGKWEESKIDSLVDWLVSPDGLNYNIFRYNIGGGDDPQNRNCEVHHMVRGKGIRAEMPGFKHYPTDTAYDWQADSAQIKIMLKIRERRPDAIFEAFSNSAPWYMTVSGCVGGHKDKNKDNLRPDCYEAFADYLIDVCKHFKDAYGLEFRTLEPFNEPLTDYWYQNGSQEGCHFDTSSQIAFIKVLYPKLKASGLNTVISASDETCLAHALTALKAYTEAGIMPMVGQWNTHTYYGSNEEKAALRDSISKVKGQMSKVKGQRSKALDLSPSTLDLRLWQSETGDGGRGIKGNLKMLQRLFDDMRYLQPAAWLDWQYYGENDTQWCHITGDFKSQTMRRHSNYYVRQHVTKYIKKGYTILNVDDRQTLAAISTDGKETVIVALNNSRDTVTITYNLPNSKRTITLKPWSVETLVLK